MVTNSIVCVMAKRILNTYNLRNINPGLINPLSVSLGGYPQNWWFATSKWEPDMNQLHPQFYQAGMPKQSWKILSLFLKALWLDPWKQQKNTKKTNKTWLHSWVSLCFFQIWLVVSKKNLQIWINLTWQHEITSWNDFTSQKWLTTFHTLCQSSNFLGTTQEWKKLASHIGTHRFPKDFASLV